jgi:hypothetical protein
MNDKIKQLAEQAKKYALDAMIKITDKEQALKVYSETYDTQFAELIVRECAKIGDNYQEILGNEPECYNCRKVAYGIVDKIKQHFGVEE